MDVDLEDLGPFLDGIRGMEDIPHVDRSYLQRQIFKLVSERGVAQLHELLSYASLYALANYQFPKIVELYGEEVVRGLLSKVVPQIYQYGFIANMRSLKNPDVRKVVELLDVGIPGDQIWESYEVFEIRFELERSQKGQTKVQKVCRFRGRVQGVSFRGNCGWFADMYGIRGFARNERDGTVTVLAQGYEPAIKMFLDAVLSKYSGDEYNVRMSIEEQGRITEPHKFFYQLYSGQVVN